VKKLAGALLLTPIILILGVIFLMITEGMVSEKLLLITVASVLLIPVSACILAFSVLKSKTFEQRQKAIWIALMFILPIVGIPFVVNKEFFKAKDS
jgi:predicted Na+-dependent transporter